LWQQKKIDEAQNWDDFFDNVHVSRLDTPRLTALLKECVLNSQKKNYHNNVGKLENPRNTSVCLCNSSSGCIYKTGSNSTSGSQQTSGSKQKSKNIPSTLSSGQPVKTQSNAWKTPLLKGLLASSSSSSSSSNASSSSAPSSSSTVGFSSSSFANSIPVSSSPTEQKKIPYGDLKV